MTRLLDAAGPGLAADLVAAVADQAPRIGPNYDAGPGLTTYRLVRPQSEQWAVARDPAVGCVVQGELTVHDGGRSRRCGPAELVVFEPGAELQLEITGAAPDEPFLGFVLRIAPADVRRLAGTAPPVLRAPRRGPAVYRTSVALREALLRLLCLPAGGPDDRVLAPVHRLEIVHRLVWSPAGSAVRSAAGADVRRGVVSAVARYVDARIHEPLQVSELAATACLSPSALSRTFREVTGVAPYQFVKSMRLARACTLLTGQELSVAEVARRVGFADAGYFGVEFRRRFGTTPHAYARLHREAVPLGVDRATGAGAG